jgi:hyperosmotically inducible protein
MKRRSLICLIPSLAFYGAAVAAEKNTSDDAIYDFVRRKLASDQIVKGGAIKVEVSQGVVTLTGTVEQEKQKERATKLAKKIAGVKSVTNGLVVAHKGAVK